MPSDTASAPTVQDDRLQRMALAGPNWRCAYCGSDQRKLDGSCQQCGASAAEAIPPRAAPVPTAQLWARIRRFVRRHKVAVGIASALVVIVAIVLWVRREREYGAVVETAHWTQRITVERYTIWHRDGWRQNQPDDAFDVASKGQQIHHYESVLDGYDTQHYTEQVACGQTCRDVPQRCSESCTSNGNGFATCSTRCTGGGQSCSTKYCSESRTRQVPRYRQEPRYAEAISYRIWDWGAHRTVEAKGTGTTNLRWPTEEAKLGQGLGEREQEREQRSASYDVVLRYDDTKRLTFDVTLAELEGFAIGTRHELKIKGDRVVVDGRPRAVRP